MRFVLAALVGLVLGCGEKPTVVSDHSEGAQQTDSRREDVAPSAEPAQTAGGNSSDNKLVENSIGMRFAHVSRGAFLMGASSDEEGFEVGEQQHTVTLSRDFHLGVFEVTQAQYKKVIGENPSYFQGDKLAVRDPKTGQVIKDVDSSNHPVDNISHDNAVEFCRRLSALPEEQAAGRRYRLPTEAEWEYACRATASTVYDFGNDVSRLSVSAWYDANSGEITHPVGSKQPNKFGVYDMHGNVWEWCSDWHDVWYYANSPGTDPMGPDSGTYRILRGGSGFSGPDFCRCAYRLASTPDNVNNFYGFRVVLE